MSYPDNFMVVIHGQDGVSSDTSSVITYNFRYDRSQSTLWLAGAAASQEGVRENLENS